MCSNNRRVYVGGAKPNLHISDQRPWQHSSALFGEYFAQPQQQQGLQFSIIHYFLLFKSWFLLKKFVIKRLRQAVGDYPYPSLDVKCSDITHPQNDKYTNRALSLNFLQRKIKKKKNFLIF